MLETGHQSIRKIYLKFLRGKMVITEKNVEPASINYSANNKRLSLDSFVYIPILKNAHRYVSTVMTAYNFQLDNNVSLENKTILVVLRDPIERWFAGASQFLYWQVDGLQITEEVMKLLTHLIVLDGHSRSQVNFLTNVDTGNCIFFNCDDEDFEKYLHHYCRRTFGGIVDMDNLGPSRPPSYHTRNHKYIEFKNKLKEMCTTEHLEKLQKYYSKDYQLLNNVNFYRG